MPVPVVITLWVDRNESLGWGHAEGVLVIVGCRHWYTDPQSMFNGRYTFDSMKVAKDSYVFASEYAVFDWGIQTIPRGNIQVRGLSH